MSFTGDQGSGQGRQEYVQEHSTYDGGDAGKASNYDDDYEGQNEQFDVPELEEENDIIMLTNQITPDEVLYNEDILATENLIAESRLEDEEEKRSVLYFNIWEVVKKGAINLVLPFINGMMLGFGEILAHEIGFKYNWYGAKVVPQKRVEQKRSISSKFL